MHRNSNIEKASSDTFDVAIIGGGITGAGIFLKCCQSGLKTVLVDQADFAGGTSSRSAKMIHGGLRYLQYLQVKLVKEALEEREYLLENYPHLVRPLPFLLPIYDSHFARMKIKVGLSGYDALAGNSKLPGHKSLSKDEVASTYPMLRQKGLKGGFYYYDAITNDARLTNEVIMQGSKLGGLALNYVSAATPAGDGQVDHLICRDEISGQEINIKAGYYISAAGIWTDEFLGKSGSGKGISIMKPSKGVHIVVDGKRFPEKDVLLVPCEDNRFIWICPWEDGLVNIGATDTPFEGDLREPGTTGDDVRYLLENVNRYLKGFQLTEDDILSVFSGLRPLLNEDGEEDTVKVSRDYKIWWENENLLTIAGGKLTSFLSMADNVLKLLSDKLTIPANGNTDQIKKQDGNGDSKEIELIRSDNSNKVKLVDHLNHDLADVIYFVRHQHAVKIGDVLSRRLSISYGMQSYDEELVQKVASVMERELGWTPDEKQDRIQDYQKQWKILHSWTK